MSLRDDILACKPAMVKCSVPEWGAAGEKVYIRVMSGMERDAWEAEIYTQKQTGDDTAVFQNVSARLAVRCVCDETGQRLFSDADAAELGSTHSVALKRVADASMRVNKLGKSDLDELTKNFKSESSASSGSGSPLPSECPLDGFSVK